MIAARVMQAPRSPARAKDAVLVAVFLSRHHQSLICATCLCVIHSRLSTCTAWRYPDRAFRCECLCCTPVPLPLATCLFGEGGWCSLRAEKSATVCGMRPRTRSARASQWPRSCRWRWSERVVGQSAAQRRCGETACSGLRWMLSVLSACPQFAA